MRYIFARLSWYLNASGIILIASGLVQKRVRSGSPDAFRYHLIASGLPPRSTLGTNPLNISKIADNISYLHVRCTSSHTPSKCGRRIALKIAVRTPSLGATCTEIFRAPLLTRLRLPLRYHLRFSHTALWVTVLLRFATTSGLKK